MKKIKLFVMICVSFCLMTLATLGVFSAFNNTEYTLDGTLEYEITDALVNVFTSVYKANTPQTISEINQTIEEISTTNAIPANLTNVSANTLQSSGKTTQFVDDVSITFSEESTTYYLVVNIQNQAPAMNTWAVIDDNIELPENVSLYTNTVQTSITSDKKAIVYAFNIEEPSYQEKTFKSKIKIGIKDLADQDFNLKKLKIEGTTVSAANTDITGAVIIPEGIKTIKANGFQNCESIMAVVLPDSLTTINSYAFKGCKILNTLKMGNKITKIESGAFQNCCGLRSFAIPEGVTSLSGTFSDCSGLEIISIPSSLTQSWGSTFNNCSSLKIVNVLSIEAWLKLNFYNSDMANPLYYGADLCIENKVVREVVVPDNISSISRTAFINYKNLETIKFHSGMKSTGYGAFYGCSNLKNVYVDSIETWLNMSMPYISNNHSMYSNPLTYSNANLYINNVLAKDIVIPESITTIKPWTFANCSSIETVKMHENVDTIGDGAFYWCPNIKRVNIPSKVTVIEHYAFSGCYAMERLDITSMEAWLNTSFDWAYTNIINEGADLYLNNELVTDIVIPESITEIKCGPLAYYKKLKSVTLHDKVTKIHPSAFTECSNLEKIYITNAETSVLEEIGDYAFNECSSLNEVTIPQSLKTVGNGAFEDTSCKILNIMSIESYLSVSYGDSLSNPKKTSTKLLLNGNAITELVIPENLTEIPSNAFSGCTELETVTIPDSVTILGSNCFSNCSNLKTVNILNTSGLKTIASNAFYNCSILENISIPQLVETIGSYAFYNTSIKSLTIPASVTTIGDSAFSYCYELNTITFEQESNLEIISNSAFSSCYKLCQITLPESLKTIGDYAFSNCVSIEKITIPKNITSIGEYAFNKCTGLKLVNFDEINSELYLKYTFYYCSNIETLNVSSIESWLKVGSYGYFSSPLYYAKNFTVNNNVLTDLVIPESVLSIKSYAFNNVNSLLSVTIHENVTSIEGSAFSGCYKLVRIKDLRTTGASSSNFPSNTDMEYITESEFVNLLQTEGNYYTYSIKDSEGVVIKKYLMGLIDTTVSTINDLDAYNITDIYPYACYNNKNLIELTIPNTILNMGNYAFTGCSSVMRIKDFRRSPSKTYLPTSNAGCEYITSGDYKSEYKTEGNYITFTNGEEKYLMGMVDNNISEINDLDTYGITSIYHNVFYNNKNLISITIPNTITNISSYAFYGCSNLKTLVFEENSSCTSIGGYAFYNCTSLESINIPEGVKTIQSYTFYNCRNLKTVNIPTTLTQIYSYAFSNCSSLQNVDISSLESWLKISFSSDYGYLSHVSNLTLNGELITEVVVPETITQINAYAFYNNKNIVSVTIPSTVTRINGYAFGGCNSLKYITIPQSVKQIYGYAFSNCTSIEKVVIDSLESWLQISFSETSSNPINSAGGLYVNNELVTDITIPENITEIKQYAFYNYNYIVSATIPSHVKIIGRSAFNRCSNIETINISEGPTTIGIYAFYNCSSLTQITIPNTVTSIGADAFENCTNLINVTLSSVLTSLPNNLFQNCTSLKNITVPDTVTSIGSNVFYNCTSLESINLPEGITNIPDYAFYKCSSLKLIDIPEGVTNIGKYAFEYCASLKDITFPSTLKNVGADAFWECSGVKTVNAASIESWLNIKFEDLLTTPLRNADGLYINGELVVNVKIPKSITTLNAHAFQYCKSLQSITIHSQITSIPYATFYGCSNLREVIFEEGSQCTSIAYYAFEGCINLKQIKLPSSITSIGSSCFEDAGIKTLVLSNISIIPSSTFWWSAIETLYISKELTEVQRNAFFYAQSLKTIYYEGTEEEFSQIVVDSDNNGYFKSAQVIYNYNEWELINVITNSTCSTYGTGVYVSIWGDVKQDTIPKLAHNYHNGTCKKCGTTGNLNVNLISGSYGFVNDGFGNYVSNNKYQNSSTASAQLTATADTTLVIKYLLDTEGGFDKFTITVNGTAVSDANGISGLKKGEVSISLNSGDIVVISYVKDDTVSCIGDFVSFSIAS